MQKSIKEASVTLQEEQRKVSNMNDCRDAWAALMRTAAQQQAGQLKSFANHPTANDTPGLLSTPHLCMFAAAYCPASGMSFARLLVS